MPIDPSTAFVSYSREDLEFVLRLAKDLKAKGAKVWMDRLDIRPGQRWEVEIEAAVDACSRMLVILSPAAIASKNVLAEASLAIDEGKVVIPVLFRDCKVPFRLRPFHYADFRGGYDTGIEELLGSLSGGQEAFAVDVAEQARLEEERKQAEAEQVRREEEERERKADEEKARKKELEQQRIAAEQARLEEERKLAEVAQARREQEERERKAAEERARQEELERHALLLSRRAWRKR